MRSDKDREVERRSMYEIIFGSRPDYSFSTEIMITEFYDSFAEECLSINTKHKDNVASNLNISASKLIPPLS